MCQSCKSAGIQPKLQALTRTESSPSLHHPAEGRCSSPKKKCTERFLDGIFRHARQRGWFRRRGNDSIDATGLESRYISRYFRRGKNIQKQEHIYNSLELRDKGFGNQAYEAAELAGNLGKVTKDSTAVGDFVAGFGDSLSFGLSGKVRQALEIDVVDYESGAYVAGEATEIAVELPITGGSAYLKSAAKSALKAEKKVALECCQERSTKYAGKEGHFCG